MPAPPGTATAHAICETLNVGGCSRRQSPSDTWLLPFLEVQMQPTDFLLPPLHLREASFTASLMPVWCLKNDFHHQELPGCRWVCANFPSIIRNHHLFTWQSYKCKQLYISVHTRCYKCKTAAMHIMCFRALQVHSCFPSEHRERNMIWGERRMPLLSWNVVSTCRQGRRDLLSFPLVVQLQSQGLSWRSAAMLLSQCHLSNFLCRSNGDWMPWWLVHG